MCQWAARADNDLLQIVSVQRHVAAMFVTRFAPSPTGPLHLGHAFSALSAYDAAMAAGGRFILRIEDIDLTRCKQGFEAAIYDDLTWLGIKWEVPVRRQSGHMADYAKALDQLIGMGVMYRCFKTRKELLVDSASAPHHIALPYHGAPVSAADEAAKLAAGAAFAWRLSMEKCQQHLGAAWSQLGCMMDGIWTFLDPLCAGDVILARKEFPTSYHLASVYDDALQGMTHIIRGEDLIEAPHVQVLLQKLLGLPTPAYHHHRLILDDDGKRLAKRNQSETLAALRAAGATPHNIRARLGLVR
jgi:glutamyl-Q tRNA(Asp) synthetase